MQIGIAGIGKMGAAIAQRLMEVGHKVTAWNRSAAKTKPLADAGAAVAATPTELANNAEAVITILTDAAAIDAVYNGASGLLSGDVRGKLLSLMGAEPADAARAKPILDQLCRRLEHGGPVGAGAILKFTVNMPLMIYWQALGEALALCRSLELDPARLMDMLSETSGGPNVLKVRGPGIAAMLKGGDGGPVTFDVAGAIKDLRAMLAEGKVRGVELPLVEKTLACYEEAQREVSGAAEVS